MIKKGRCYYVECDGCSEGTDGPDSPVTHFEDSATARDDAVEKDFSFVGSEEFDYGWFCSWCMEADGADGEISEPLSSDVEFQDCFWAVCDSCEKGCDEDGRLLHWRDLKTGSLAMEHDLRSIYDWAVVGRFHLCYDCHDLETSELKVALKLADQKKPKQWIQAVLI